MPRKSKFDRLVEESGKPLPEILAEILSQHETVPEAAASIPISYRYVKEKIDEFGLHKLPAKWVWPDAKHEPS